MSIIRFGSKTPEKYEVCVKSLLVLTNDEDDDVELHAHVVPFIAGKLQSSRTEIAGVELVKDDENREIDLLIGRDYCWEFMKNIEKIGEQSYLIQTSLGNILGGTQKQSNDNTSFPFHGYNSFLMVT